MITEPKINTEPEIKINGEAEANIDIEADDAALVTVEPDTFPRAYVEQLRQESAEHRIKAKRTDDLAHRLHDALVAADGRLADPTDLAYDEAHLDDPEALTAALEALLARKPHLATRRPSGDIGQGASGTGDDFSLGALLRARA